MKNEKNATKEGEDHEQPLIAHLAEIRNRMIRSMICVLVVFLLLSPFYSQIYTTIATPLISQLPEGTNMIATEVASPFFVPFKLTGFLAIFICMPYLLYQLWAFVSPGLYKNEKGFAMPLLISSIFLFYAGISFAFYVVFPLVFSFFTSVAPEGVAVMTDISHYLNFILKMFFAFGLAFEVPVATILLVSSGIVEHEELKRKRPYIVVGAFIVGMLLTPPDIISQFLLALPMWILFEAGLILSKRFIPVITDEKEVDSTEDTADEKSNNPASEFYDDV
ncbi:MAG: sec-independent protein translocase protein TatC [Gammaproteobacteria bacterium]|jgi:sec-independent protein translocase protein TatC